MTTSFDTQSADLQPSKNNLKECVKPYCVDWVTGNRDKQYRNWFLNFKIHLL